MPAEYYLDFTSEELTVTAGVNRARLLTDLTGEGLRTIYPVNPWIKPKENQLTAFLSWPEDKPHAPGLGTVKVRLFLADPNKPFPSPLKVLAEFSWPALPKIAEEYPYTMTVPFLVDEAPPCTLWRDAEAVPRLEPADREAIIGQAEMLRLALTGGDAARAAEIARYKHEDDARSHGHRPEAAAEEAVEQYNMIINAPKLRSEASTLR